MMERPHLNLGMPGGSQIMAYNCCTPVIMLLTALGSAEREGGMLMKIVTILIGNGKTHKGKGHSSAVEHLL